MARVRWSLRAADALERIRDYIASHSPGASKKTVRGIYDRIMQLKKFPRMGGMKEIYEDIEIREIFYGHYRIEYAIDNEDQVEVLDILHGAKNLEDNH